jgi:CarboxypepD_reg-like domain/TonB-dependent Receptor Plug Domain
MKQIYNAVFVFSLLSLAMPAVGQTTEPVSGNFEQAKFDDFIKAVESQTSYHFYYDRRQFDSLKITANYERVDISTVFDTLFRYTDYHYLIDSASHIFLTKGHEIRTELPVGFFDKQPDQRDFDVAIFDFMHDNEEKQRLTEEDKLFEIGKRTRRIRGGRATLTGNIRNILTGEPVVGAVVYNAATSKGAATDPFGYYSIELPTGRNMIKISCVGMQETIRQLIVYDDGKLDIELREHITPLKEVVVEAERGENVSGTQMGLEKLDIKTMKQVPVAFGETDILKVVLTLPGVQSVGESSTGLNVRGGSTDQNLTMFDDATIFNTAHLFGFFSAFNPDVIKDVELYKSGIPAEYGGRISSVLAATSREGNKKKFSGSGGIGLITGRLTLEGPLKKDKSSILIGGRSTYSDWLLRKIPNKSLKNSDGSFYDLNFHFNHEADNKNTVDVTGYFSEDQFRLNSDTLYQYNNFSAAMNWKHAFSPKLYGVLTGAFSQYRYRVSSDINAVNAQQLDYRIEQLNGKADFSFQLNQQHLLSFGASSIRYNLAPGTLKPLGTESQVVADELEHEQAFESAVYVGDQLELSSKLTLYVGLRYSFYNYIGPRSVFRYAEGIPRDEGTIIDTVTYSKGKAIASYQAPEFRISARYLLSENASVKVSLQRMSQYIHVLSNTTAVAPTDTWKLSDPYIQPQLGDQVSIGYYRNFKANTIEASIEGYYKTLDNFLDYRGGAILTMNHHIETDVIGTKGRAYGIEILLKKVTGKFNGWISYTYSRSLLKTKSRQAGEMVNDGQEYPSNYDKPHDVTVISNYRFSRRFSISLNFTYSTGRPITIPIQRYTLDGSARLFYTNRNQARIPDYYRFDFSMNVEGNHKIRKLAHSSWSFSVYNLTGRKNAYSVFFRSQDGAIKGYKLSIFGQPIPTVTYNFRF